MDMSNFDPTAFLGGTYTEGFDTRIPLHKAGEWSGYIGAGDKDLAVRTVETKAGPRVVAELWYYTEDPQAVPESGRSPIRARQTVWLDFVPGTQSLDFSPGNNRVLGYVLTALGFQDKNGKIIKPWSWNALKGSRIKYRVEHKPRQDTGELQAEVAGVLTA